MIKALITDVSYVLLYPKDSSYTGSLNALYKSIKDDEAVSFFDRFKLNANLIDYYISLKDKVNMYILTSDVIQDAPDLQLTWDGLIKKIFSASKMGTHKSKPEAFNLVLNKLDLKAENVIYVDDNEDNTRAANSVGLATILHKSTKETVESIEKMLRENE